MKKWILVAAVCACALAVRAGVPVTWKGGNGVWDDAANWDTGLPGAGDAVTVSGGTVTLTNATPQLGSFTLDGATLLFKEPVRELPANLVAALNADAVSVTGGGIVTHATNTMSVAEYNASEDKLWRIDGRVMIACGTFTLDSGAKVDVVSRGYAETASGTYSGSPGPGGRPNTSYNCGGSHGGAGSGAHREKGATYGAVYGSVSDPDMPGSCGGRGRAATDEGLPGGGLVRIIASGTATVNGNILADGGLGFRNSFYNARYGGSGGGVYLQAASFAGSGKVSANGRCGEQTYYAGGGGRIAVHYDPAAQTTAGLPSITFSANAPSCSTTVKSSAEIGTIWFTDARFISDTVDGSTGNILAGVVHVGSKANLSLSSLTVSNIRFGLSDDLASSLTLAGEVVVRGRLSELTFGGDNRLPAHEMTFRSSSAPPDLSFGSFAASNGAVVHVYASATNDLVSKEARVAFGDKLMIGAGGTVNVWCHPTNGATVKLSGTAAEIAYGGTLQSVQAGYIGYGNKGYGPGPGSGTYGAGHGGMGPRGDGMSYANMQYDSLEYPCMPGSAGGTGRVDQEGSAGGGVVHLTLTGDLVNNGTIRADAKVESLSDGSGSGSGGTVFVSCRTVSGAGSFTANGGGPESEIWDQGAGGRIAIHYDPALQPATGPVRFSAAPGADVYSVSMGVMGVKADMGTIWLPDDKLLGDGTLIGPGAVSAGELHLGDWTGWRPAHLVVDGARTRYAIGSYRVDIPGDVVISNRAQFAFGGGAYAMTNAMTRLPYTEGAGPVVHVGGSFTLVDQGSNVVKTRNLATGFHLLAGGNVGEAYVGASLTVDGAMNVGSNCWVYPVSHPYEGDSPRFRVRSLRVEAFGGFDAYSRGYTGGGPKTGGAGSGPGGGRTGGAGASHGGYGGANSPANLSPLYGDQQRPRQPGSGAGPHATTGELSGAGGGLVWIEARKDVYFAGSFLADGTALTSAGGCTGSGGGVHVDCRTWTATETAAVSAHGGNGQYASAYAGGGGRVAIWRLRDADTAALSPVLVRGTGNLATPSFITAMENPEGRVPDMTTGSFHLGQHKPTGFVLCVR